MERQPLELGTFRALYRNVDDSWAQVCLYVQSNFINFKYTSNGDRRTNKTASPTALLWERSIADHFRGLGLSCSMPKSDELLTIDPSQLEATQKQF